MSRGKPFRIGVLGLGNLMRTDDAVGMLALRRLSEDERLPPDIEVIEGGTLGLDLLDALYGITHLLVLDAVDTGTVPGTLAQFAGNELANLPTAKSVHLLGLSDLISALRLMEASPEQVVLLGIQPESTDWGTMLTPTVEASQNDMINLALMQIAQWMEQISGVTGTPVQTLATRGFPSFFSRRP